MKVKELSDILDIAMEIRELVYKKDFEKAGVKYSEVIFVLEESKKTINEVKELIGNIVNDINTYELELLLNEMNPKSEY